MSGMSREIWRCCSSGIVMLSALRYQLDEEGMQRVVVPSIRRAISWISARAIHDHVLHCEIPEVEKWAQTWLEGTDRTKPSAEMAIGAARRQEIEHQANEWFNRLGDAKKCRAAKAAKAAVRTARSRAWAEENLGSKVKWCGWTDVLEFALDAAEHGFPKGEHGFVTADMWSGYRGQEAKRQAGDFRTAMNDWPVEVAL